MADKRANIILIESETTYVVARRYNGTIQAIHVIPDGDHKPVSRASLSTHQTKVVNGLYRKYGR